MSKNADRPPVHGDIYAYAAPPLPKKDRGPILRLAAAAGLAVVCLVLGALIGSAASSGQQSASESKPATTVTAPALGDGCQEVAAELWSILDVTVNQIVIPYSDVTQNLANALMNGINVGQIEADTRTLEQVGAVTTDATNRVTAVGPEYQRCVNP